MAHPSGSLIFGVLIVSVSVGLTLLLPSGHQTASAPYAHRCWDLIRRQLDMTHKIHDAEQRGDKAEARELRDQYARFRENNGIPDDKAGCGLTWNDVLRY